MFQCNYLLAFSLITGDNLKSTLLATMLTTYIAPTTARPDVLKIKGYLNGVDLPTFLVPNILFIKVCTYQAQLNSRELLRFVNI